MRSNFHNGLPVKRCWPVGAEFVEDTKVHFRVWAPEAETVSVLVGDDEELKHPIIASLDPEPGGYFSKTLTDVKRGAFYRYRLASGDFPDPVSRFQPLGPHGPSQLIDSRNFKWSDTEWQGVLRKGQILYEMHIGTFTQEGTWNAARGRLPYLAELGVTVLEIMPVADFPGRYGWGYDGVDLFAPTHLYGIPDDFRAFVDKAHQLGLGVILDVVYNHFGPDGNFMEYFSQDYFTDRYENEWGRAINFDGENSKPVREFFAMNAAYWITEFHLDGLRLDATQQMFDSSPNHILAEISQAARIAGGKRMIYLVAENEPQQSRLVRSLQEGGYNLDALWNDDFHHTAIVALTGKHEAYYMDYQGKPQEFVSAAKYGYLYQGQYYKWQKKSRGAPSWELDPERFVNYIQNHDQIANSLRGQRVHSISDSGSVRALTALLLLGPGTPMLFQGQEFAASTPFLYFADHDPKLAKQVAEGRRKFLEQFPSIAQPDAKGALHNPEQEETFQVCKLRFEDVASHHEIYNLHRDLILLRRSDLVINGKERRKIDGAVLSQSAFVLRYFGDKGDDRLLLFNFGPHFHLQPMPEPLIAPAEGARWHQQWCSEDIQYGGESTPPLISGEEWHIPAHAAILLTTDHESNE